MLLLLLIGGFSVSTTPPWDKGAPNAAPEKEVSLIFPEQILPPEPPPPPPPEPELKQFTRTSQSKAEAEPPAKANFVSDRNTVAASKMAPAPDGTVNMPTIAGVKQRVMDVAERTYHDGEVKDEQASQAKAPPVPKMLTPPPTPPPAPPKVAEEKPVEKPTPTEVAKMEIKDKPLLKMLEESDPEAPRVEVNKPAEKPKVQLREPSESRPPALDPITKGAAKPEMNDFVPNTRKTEVKGTLSNRAEEDSVDAERTPLGVYSSSVMGAVGKKWHLYSKLKKDAATYGNLRVRFYTTKNGKVEDLKIISDPRDADPRMADFTLRAIKDAKLPPIPADLLPMLEGERVKFEYDVLIY